MERKKNKIEGTYKKERDWERSKREKEMFGHAQGMRENRMSCP